MKILKKKDIVNLLTGCALLGTGGGGSLKEGLKFLDKYFSEDDSIKVIDLNEVPDDSYVATPYSCGAPDGGGNEKFSSMERIETLPSILALEAIEKYIGEKIYAVTTTELGGSNSAEAICAACHLGIPLLDADPAGRSVPELQHSTYFLHKVPIYPMAVATAFGEKIIIENVIDDFRAEDIVRSIAVASDNMVGVVDHVHKGKIIKDALIPNMISYALKLGEIINSDENTNVIVKEIISDFKGKLLFEGKVTNLECVTRDGFNYGEIRLKGHNEYINKNYRIKFKNENIISYIDDEIDVTVPDLICMVDKYGQPVTTPNFNIGDELTILTLPAPSQWQTPEGLKCFGPEHFKLETEYRGI